MEPVVKPLRDALASFLLFLPALVAGLIVLLVGWVIAAVARRVINAVLPRTGFDRFLARHKIVDRSPDARAGSRVVASAAYWAILLIAFMQAANVWGLDFVAIGLGRVIAFVPNIVSAVLIFGAALFVGNWLRGRMRAREAGEGRAWGVAFLPEAVRAAIVTVGAFFALRQLLIAPELLMIAFALVLGAIAVATAIAVGLGARRTVEEATRDWYERQRSDGARRRGSPPPPTAGPVGSSRRIS
jgi:hypothetical protein